MHVYKKTILLLFLFGYSLINFGAHKEIALPNIKLDNRALALVTFADSFPEDGGEEVKIKFAALVNPGLVLKRKEGALIGNFTHNTTNISALQNIGDLLTILKQSPFSALRLIAADESYMPQYNVSHESVLSAAQKFNRFLDQRGGYNVSVQQIEQIDFTDEEKATLAQLAALKSNKSKNMNFLLVIPIIGGAAVVGLVGPAVLLANLAALWANAFALAITAGVTVVCIGSSILMLWAGVTMALAGPALIIMLSEMFSYPKK